MSPRTKRNLISALVLWQFGLSALLLAAGAEEPKVAVLARMLWGVNLLWIAGVGALSMGLRRRVAELGRRFGGTRWLAFLAGAVAMALIEEAITTAMTNCAPLFGAELGEVYITASANYWDVVLMHSVVVMIPQFAAWAWLLRRYDASPLAAMLCYGLTGFVNEALFSGPNPLLLPQWVLVYGLMVYLPAHLYDTAEGRTPAPWWGYPLAVVLPVIASLPVVALLLLVVAPGHPRVHFPPM